MFVNFSCGEVRMLHTLTCVMKADESEKAKLEQDWKKYNNQRK